jgi:hypothetical protein
MGGGNSFIFFLHLHPLSILLYPSQSSYVHLLVLLLLRSNCPSTAIGWLRVRVGVAAMHQNI